MDTPMSETHAPLSTTARTNLKGEYKECYTTEGWGSSSVIPAGHGMSLPFAREGSEAACLDVDAAVSVGLILVR